MAKPIVRQESTVEPFDVFDRLDRWFNSFSPFHLGRPWSAPIEELGRMVLVDEFQEDGNLVIRADLPGIDPEKDVRLTMSNGLLHIDAERREEEQTEKRGYVRRELRYGSFHRTLPLPEGAREDDISASYNDGILEVRVPAPSATQPKQIPIAH